MLDGEKSTGHLSLGYVGRERYLRFYQRWSVYQVFLAIINNNQESVCKIAEFQPRVVLMLPLDLPPIPKISSLRVLRVASFQDLESWTSSQMVLTLLSSYCEFWASYSLK